MGVGRTASAAGTPSRPEIPAGVEGCPEHLDRGAERFLEVKQLAETDEVVGAIARGQRRRLHRAQRLASGRQIPIVPVLPESFQVGPAQEEVGGVGRGARRKLRRRGDRLIVLPLIVELADRLERPLSVERKGREDRRGEGQRKPCANPLHGMDLCVLTARHLI